MAYLQFGCSLWNFSLPSMGDHLINLAAKCFSLHAHSEEGTGLDSWSSLSPVREKPVRDVLTLTDLDC